MKLTYIPLPPLFFSLLTIASSTPAEFNFPFQLYPQVLSLITTMSALTESIAGWHPGEVAVHKLLNVPNQGGKPTSRGMPPQYGYRIAASPLVAFGALDGEGRPWTTVWGGERGFSRPIQQGILGVKSLVDRQHDPVIQALLGSAPPEGEAVHREDKPLSALSVDLEHRDRVKLAGRFIAGALSTNAGVSEVEMAVHVQETLGNCPKYMNKKVIRAHLASPQLVSDTLPLPKEALDLISQADMFFLTTANGESMDTNHRGGPPGFVRVANNSPDNVVLVYPEYSGNRLYESLGNLYLDPKIGIAVPDFNTSDVLYLTGTTEILTGADAATLLPHTKLALKITLTAARLVKDSLPFRGTAAERSPYNPPVRRLATEGALLPAAAADRQEAGALTATLVRREAVTPSINRYIFRLATVRHKTRVRVWKAGQYVTLDFGPELDVGWSHMREDDPGALNDDFVRTFTVSGAPPPEGGEIGDGMEVEVTARTKGPVTGFLGRYNLKGGMELEVPVVGFGGEDGFRIAVEEGGKMPVFVAGGVGITPLLAQVGGLIGSEDVRLRVIWGLRAEDLGLAVEVLERNKGLGKVVRLFVSGQIGEKETGLLASLEGFGAVVERRRLGRDDVLNAADYDLDHGRKYYLCVGPGLQKVLVEWLEGEEVVAESFNY